MHRGDHFDPVCENDMVDDVAELAKPSWLSQRIQPNVWLTGPALSR
jgi:hypothetical protein